MRIASTGMVMVGLGLAACGGVNSDAADGTDTTDTTDDAPAPDAAVAAPDAASLCGPLDCDDGDACTTDACEAAGCTHTSAVEHGSATLAYAGGTELFTVPACVTDLTVETWGGAGGNAPPNVGGAGAYVSAILDVAPGDLFVALVGQRGADAANTTDQGGGSGGGATAFFDLDATRFVVAGGGGGAFHYFDGKFLSTSDGVAGAATADGTPGVGGTAGAAGTGGGGGVTGLWNGWHTGTAGAGLLGDGVGDSTGLAGYGTPNTPGQALTIGGLGGQPGSAAGARAGGFGGGGAAGFTGGGGGGYSGGGGGGYGAGGTEGGGGGGGSLASVAGAVYKAAENPDADGKIVLTW